MMKILSRHHGFYNDNFFDRTVTGTCFRFAYLVDNIHPFDHPADNRMFSIEEIIIDKVDEKL